MELSLQSKFNQFNAYSSSSSSLYHQSRKVPRSLFVPSLLSVVAHHELHAGCTPLKNSIQRCSRTYGLPEEVGCSSIGHPHVAGKFFHFNQAVASKNFNRGPKLSKFVARSELAGTGSAGASYSLDEIELGSKIRGICFYAVTAFSAIFLFVLMLVAHPSVLIFDRYRRKAHHLVAKIWSSLTVAPFYDIEFKGLENLPPPDTPAVYVSNHQSFLDIYTLLTLGRSFKFISKTAIFLFPVIGWAMFLMGIIPLKRMDTRSQLDCMKQCMSLIKKGGSVFFFPEGTRSKDGELGPFKKGAFTVAAKTGVPVVPITLIGTGKIMPAGEEGRLYPGSVKVVVHRPIEGNNPEALCTEARYIIAGELTSQG